MHVTCGRNRLFNIEQTPKTIANIKNNRPHGESFVQKFSGTACKNLHNQPATQTKRRHKKARSSQTRWKKKNKGDTFFFLN
jgi:hypothetical protein